MNQIIVQLREFFLKKAQGRCETKRIAYHMLFLDSTIVNPSFFSDKRKLITESKEFGSTFEISTKLVQSILKIRNCKLYFRLDRAKEKQMIASYKEI
jgi:hypothetical protein